MYEEIDLKNEMLANWLRANNIRFSFYRGVPFVDDHFDFYFDNGRDINVVVTKDHYKLSVTNVLNKGYELRKECDFESLVERLIEVENWEYLSFDWNGKRYTIIEKDKVNKGVS